jgi:hypothetical protein
MRNAARLVLAAAIAATIIPTTSANAVYCGTLQPVCQTICRVGALAGAECLD